MTNSVRVRSWCMMQKEQTSVTWTWQRVVWAAPAAVYSRRATTTQASSSTIQPLQSAAGRGLTSAYPRHRWVHPGLRRPPRAPSATTERPASTTARRRATDARDSFDARCAKVTSTRAAFSAAASSTRISVTSAATAGFASASAPACAKKVSE